MTAEGSEPQSRIPFYRSVSGKLALLLVSVIGITTVSLTAIDYAYIRVTVREDVHRELQIHVHGLREFLQEHIESKRELAEQIATSKRIARGLAPDVGSPTALQDVREHLREALAGSRELLRASISTIDGRLIATEQSIRAEGSSSFSALHQSVQEHVLQAKERSGSVVSFMPRGIFDSSWLASAPVRDQLGALTGVVILEFDTSSLRERLSGMKTGHDSSRIRIATKDSMGEFRYLYANRDMDIFRQLDPKSDLPVMKGLQGESGLIDDFTDYRGVPVIVAYAALESGLLTVVSQIDITDAFARASEVFAALALAALVWLGIAALLALMVARRYLRPVRRLSWGTRQLMTGNLDFRVSVTTRDEVGELGHAFNDMVDTIRASRDELEDRVRARTAQLETSRNQLQLLVRALENQAELMERDLRRAEVIQRSLLPRTPPPIPGIQLSAVYIPGRNVGGDLYDVDAIDEKRLLLLMADAAGHGVSAAMLSVLFKHRLKEISSRVPISETRTVVEQLNRALVNDVSAPGVFVTAAFCVLDRETREFTVVSAGHPPLLLLRTTGELEKIEKGGPALGLYRDASFDVQHFTINRGDRLLIYTDGLSSVSHGSPTDPLEFGAALDSDATGLELLDRVLEHASRGERFEDRDDVTMLLLDASDGENHFVHRDSVIAPSEGYVENGAASYSPLRYAESQAGTFLYLHGRMTWVYGQALFDAATAVIEEERVLIIDLSSCTYLDSAVLGALHEIIEWAEQAGGTVKIQNALPMVVQSFEELGMTSVLRLMLSEPLPAPSESTVVDAESVDYRSQQLRLLKAHEVLADLNEQNRGEFASVVEDLRDEVIATSKPSRHGVGSGE